MMMEVVVGVVVMIVVSRGGVSYSSTNTHEPSIRGHMYFFDPPPPTPRHSKFLLVYECDMLAHATLAHMRQMDKVRTQSPGRTQHIQQYTHTTDVILTIIFEHTHKTIHAHHKSIAHTDTHAHTHI